MTSTHGSPPALSPDAKDWTWVLERPCPECGFDSTAFDRGDVGPMLRANATAWRSLLTDTPAVRRRTRPDQWSVLEYACHVRDVCRLFLERLDLMLSENGPDFLNWDQDTTAIEKRYDLADPLIVADELDDAAEAIATRFDAVAADQWDRTGFRSDGAAFTVESFARYFTHDPVHHLHDVQ